MERRTEGQGLKININKKG